MTPEEVEQFLYKGRGALTNVGQGAEHLKNWAESFDQRGGAGVYGDDALAIVYFSNELQAWLTPERRATIAKYRTDV